MKAKGFYYTSGKQDYFLVTENVRKTDKVIRALIDKVCDKKGICDDVRERAKTDHGCLDDFRRRMDFATIGVKYGGWDINGKYFGGCGDKNTIVFTEDGMEIKLCQKLSS